MIYNIQTLRVFFAMLVVTGHLQTLYIAMGLVFAFPVWRRFSRGKGHLTRNEEPADAQL